MHPPVRHVVACHDEGLSFIADPDGQDHVRAIEEAYVFPNRKEAEDARGGNPMALSVPYWFARRYIKCAAPPREAGQRQRHRAYLVFVQRYDDIYYVADETGEVLSHDPEEAIVLGGRSSRQLRQRLGILAVRVPLWFAQAYVQTGRRRPEIPDRGRDEHLPDWARAAINTRARHVA